MTEKRRFGAGQIHLVNLTPRESAQVIHATPRSSGLPKSLLAGHNPVFYIDQDDTRTGMHYATIRKDATRFGIKGDADYFDFIAHISAEPEVHSEQFYTAPLIHTTANHAAAVHEAYRNTGKSRILTQTPTGMRVIDIIDPQQMHVMHAFYLSELQTRIFGIENELLELATRVANERSGA